MSAATTALLLRCAPTAAAHGFSWLPQVSRDSLLARQSPRYELPPIQIRIHAAHVHMALCFFHKYWLREVAGKETICPS
jgi:hypothetical protein